MRFQKNQVNTTPNSPRQWILAHPSPGDENQTAFLVYTANQIKRFQDDPKKINITKPNDPPDGQPIGMDWWALSDQDWCNWR